MIFIFIFFEKYSKDFYDLKINFVSQTNIFADTIGFIDYNSLLI